MTADTLKRVAGGTRSRRTVLKGGAALAGALAAPAIVSPRVLASSGEVNILMWSDYLPPSFVDSFQNKT
ncbi:MAG: spermidine/putrescine ABC transporter substrate-binding protein, partial [Geminicoccaceae bacterium]